MLWRGDLTQFEADDAVAHLLIGARMPDFISADRANQCWRALCEARLWKAKSACCRSDIL
jgi:hypothetical protein